MIDEALLARLAPLPRSLTGGGVRDTLKILGEIVPIEVIEHPTGTEVLDWTVPEEWRFHAAHITDATGRRLIDAADLALHVVSGSEPVDRRLTFEELRPHLHSLPDRPASAPYRTSYWSRTWGFCVSHDRLAELERAPGPLHVVIDAAFVQGSLTIGQVVVPGRTTRELLLSTHICHPSMVNDNVTGMAALADIGRRLLDRAPLEHTVRLLFLPGTLGSISWIATNPDVLPLIDGGLVLTGLGDSSPLTYKSSRRGDTRTDRIARRVVTARDPRARLLPWDPYGYDERQFCSPGLDLAVGRLTRGVHGTYPEYHTSADDLSFVSLTQVHEAVEAVMEIVERLDAEPVLVSTNPVGEPQLGRRGLYRQTGGAIDARSVEVAYLWMLSLADGAHGIDDVVDASGLSREVVTGAFDRLASARLCELRPPTEGMGR